MQPKYTQTAVFLFGTALGTTIGLILAALFTPQSGPQTRQMLVARSEAIKVGADDVAQRIQTATQTWVSQLRSVADDMVAQGKLTDKEAAEQINEVINRVRG